MKSVEAQALSMRDASLLVKTMPKQAASMSSLWDCVTLASQLLASVLATWDRPGLVRRDYPEFGIADTFSSINWFEYLKALAPSATKWRKATQNRSTEYSNMDYLSCIPIYCN